MLRVQLCSAGRSLERALSAHRGLLASFELRQLNIERQFWSLSLNLLEDLAGVLPGPPDLGPASAPWAMPRLAAGALAAAQGASQAGANGGSAPDPAAVVEMEEARALANGNGDPFPAADALEGPGPITSLTGPGHDMEGMLSADHLLAPAKRRVRT
jgi:hypothetical protein